MQKVLYWTTLLLVVAMSSSVNAQLGQFGQTNYSAAKAGILGFTKALARELLNDWDAIWNVLQHPQMPITNNLAERALRHWVISRKISYGTRTQQGSRAFALLASVIDTCRQRGVSPWDYIALIIAQRRQNMPVPP